MKFAVKFGDKWYWSSEEYHPYFFVITAQDWANEFGINLNQAIMKGKK